MSLEAADRMSDRTVLPGSSPGGVRDMKAIRERLANIASRLLWDGELDYVYPRQDMEKDVMFLYATLIARLNVRSPTLGSDIISALREVTKFMDTHDETLKEKPENAPA